MSMQIGVHGDTRSSLSSALRDSLNTWYTLIVKC